MASTSPQQMVDTDVLRAKQLLPTPELRLAIEHELTRTSRWLTFADRLESHYIRHIGTSTIQQDRQAAILAVFVFNLWTITDYLSAADIWLQALFFRVFIASPLVLLTTWADQKGRGLRKRSRHQAVLLCLSTLPLLAVYQSSYYPSVALCYFLFPMILVFGNLSISISFVWVVVSNIVTWFAYCGVVLIDSTVPSEFRPALLISMSCLMVLTITAKHRIEGSERRAWLLARLEELRSQDLRELAATLAVESNTDALTGASNRRRFDSALAQLAAGETDCALILIDVDQFKAYNDRYGHPMGDECLARLVAITRSRVRAGSDIVARYGGEEFAVLLPNCCLRDAIGIAEHIRQALEAAAIPHEAQESRSILSASFGVAVSDRQARRSPAALIAEADRQLYLAKAHGRNRVEPQPPQAKDLPEDLDDIAWLDEAQRDGQDEQAHTAVKGAAPGQMPDVA